MRIPARPLLAAYGALTLTAAVAVIAGWTRTPWSPSHLTHWEYVAEAQGFAVVWAQVVGNSTRTMLAFLTETGVLVGPPFEVGEGLEPAIAWSGRELAIVRSSVAGATSVIRVAIVTF